MGMIVKFPQSEISSLMKKQSKGLRLAGDIVTGMITKEVPIDTGQLRRSAYVSGKRTSHPMDTLLSIYISWNTSYAKVMYYGEGYNFKEPNARPYWGSELMSNTKKLNDIIEKSIKAIR